MDELTQKSSTNPSGNWVMRQTWSSLLFAHYKVPKSLIRSVIPTCFEVETFEEEAWISVVPFFMSGIRARGLPELPFTPSFPELNVRTYITFNGRPGVYFFSLDASSKVAVSLANLTYNLPYMNANMSCVSKEREIEFTSERTDNRANKGVFSAKYFPVSDVYFAKPGTLEHWLTERYSLFVTKGMGIYEGRINHKPWPLQRAEVQFGVNTVAQSVGIPIEDPPDLLQYSNKLKVVVWPPKKVGLFF
ncbi:YqjF family protein [Alkalihalobacterium elongatum]|uniref:YqjF family protein n=1 Tax=Alkalihalobacterium elongatum TaxID=2675466 RepID=UPI001C1F23E4|nr:DUF2071 domain-containing protein [Alkalihalobacterium elongatum]